MYIRENSNSFPHNIAETQDFCGFLFVCFVVVVCFCYFFFLKSRLYSIKRGSNCCVVLHLHGTFKYHSAVIRFSL